jgi:hypothetical protein
MTKRVLSLRFTLALVAIVAIVTIAIQASSGSAQTPPTSLHLVAKSLKRVGFFPKHRPRQGDRFGFGDKLSGDDTGFDRGVCTLIGGKSLCNVQARLSKGTLSLQGFVTEKARNLPIVVLGGTGNYDGARGTAVVTDVNSSTTDIKITFK